jgi:hypothetical protein
MRVRALLLATLLAPLPALAWPADVYLDVEKGGEKFQRLGAVDWFEVEDPSIAQVEWLSSNELLVTGKALGRTLVLFYAQGTAAVWRIRVHEKGAQTQPASSSSALEAATKACPGLALDLKGPSSTVTARTEACRQALLAFFQTDAVRASDSGVNFELPALQAQLQAIQSALSRLGEKVTVKYSGAGLILEGATTPAGQRRLLWVVFRNTVGRVVIDDRLDVTDAGTFRPGTVSP